MRDKEENVVEGVVVAVPERHPHVVRLSRTAKSVPPRLELAARMYLCGIPMPQVVSETGIREQTIRKFLATEHGQDVKERVQASLDDDFNRLYSKVTKTVEDALDNPDLGVRLGAASLWLRSTRGQRMTVELTAEDIVKRLVDGKQDLSVQTT